MKTKTTGAVRGLLPSRLEKLVPPTGYAGHHMDGRIVLVGVSNAVNLLDIFRQDFPNLQAKLLATI